MWMPHICRPGSYCTARRRTSTSPFRERRQAGSPGSKLVEHDQRRPAARPRCSFAAADNCSTSDGIWTRSR